METAHPIVESACRLSVIIPTYNRKDLTERAVRSVLDQSDPIGIEVVVADDGSRDGTADYLREIFGDAIRAGRLKVEALDGTGDPGKTRNRGVARSRGSFLAFLDSDDWWRPGRLNWLEPLLTGHDLILASNDPVSRSADWLGSFLRINSAMTSTAVIRRTLFEAAGGFPEGYYGRVIPKRIPGWEDYELWLKALATLDREGKRDRFLLAENRFVEFEPQPGGAGRKSVRVQMLREAVTLMHVAPELPKRYWPTLLRRVAGAGKAIIKGQ